MDIRGESKDATFDEMREIVASYGISPEEYDAYESNKSARNTAANYLGELQKLWENSINA